MKRPLDHTGIRTWVEIDTQNLKHNFDIFRHLTKPKTRLMAIAKSNAYGHDFIQYSRVMEKIGADFIGVDSMTEAVKLRGKGIKIPILVLGYTLPELYPKAATENISLTISSFDSLEKLSEVDSKVNIHIKVDTGMHRQGFFLEDLPEVIDQLKSCKNIHLEGLYSHFASAKDPNKLGATNQQIKIFKKAAQLFRSAGYNNILRHTSATAGTLLFPEAHFDMVRVGLGLMGLWPSKEIETYLSKKIELKPVLAWNTIIGEIKYLNKSEKVGYDFTETLGRDSQIAILPVGYWHGYRRGFSNIGQVEIDGKSAKVIGRVSMDMIVIDITGHSNLKVGEIVTLLSDNSKSASSAINLASLINASWYELVTQINPLIKRFYK